MQVPKLGLPVNSTLDSKLRVVSNLVEAKSSADEISFLIIDQYLKKSE